MLFEVILSMRWLLFLSRVAFICNLFFLLAISLQMSNWLQQQDMVATIVLVGYFMVAIFNPLVILLYLVAAVRRRLSSVPAWLVIANFIFLFLQLAYVLYINGVHKKLPL
jgi:hypothetical protein